MPARRTRRSSKAACAAPLVVDAFHVAALRALNSATHYGEPAEECVVAVAKAMRGVFAHACRRFAEPLDAEKFMEPCPPKDSMNYRLVKGTLDLLRAGLIRGATEAEKNGATAFPPRMA